MPTNMRIWRSEIEAMPEGEAKEKAKADYREYGGTFDDDAPAEDQGDTP